jgi:acetate---CoA ligase (ADP-forming)
VLVRSAGEAETAAAGFGGPVAMKIDGAAFSHKTEIGGVELNVATPSAAREVYQTLTERVATAMPGAPANGVIVAPMVCGGVETIPGVQVDPVFGPAIMFGLGGVFVVVFQDVAFRLAPIGRDSHSLSARAGIGSTGIGRALAGTGGWCRKLSPKPASAAAASIARQGSSKVR